MKTKQLTVNNWRYKSHERSSSRNINIYPYKVGDKFTQSEVEHISNWIEAIGCIVNKATNTCIMILLPMSKPKDIYEIYTILEENSYTKIANRIKENERIKKERKNIAEFNSIKNQKSYKWIDENFKVTSMNMFNLKALMRFLDGTDKTFNGMITNKWIDGAKKLDVIKNNGIDFDKLKAIYDCSIL